MSIVNPYIPLVDSNILISFFIHDVHFESSQSILRKEIYINDFVVCETLNFLQNKVSFFLSQAAEESIFSSQFIFRRIEISSEVLIKAQEIRQIYADNELQFTDAVLLAQSEIFGLTLYTRDQRMLGYKKATVCCPEG